MKIIMTGGTGLIGSIILKGLRQDGHFVSNLTRQTIESTGFRFPDLADGGYEVFIHAARNREALDHFTEDAYHNMFDTDVVLPLRVMKAIRDTMQVAVIITSVYGFMVPPHISSAPATYGICKAAQVQMVREIASRIGEFGQRINGIAYGGVESERQDPGWREDYCELVPLGKMVKPEEVYGKVRFLIGPDSEGITGHILTVDGGLSL